jgi:hypothetical protein
MATGGSVPDPRDSIQQETHHPGALRLALGYRPRGGRRGDTVRMAPTPPGDVAEMDFERLGVLGHPDTRRSQPAWPQSTGPRMASAGSGPKISAPLQPHTVVAVTPRVRPRLRYGVGSWHAARYGTETSAIIR